jgi:hypothetical protein
MSNNKRNLCLREHFFLKIGVVVVVVSQLFVNNCGAGGGGEGGELGKLQRMKELIEKYLKKRQDVAFLMNEQTYRSGSI